MRRRLAVLAATIAALVVGAAPAFAALPILTTPQTYGFPAANCPTTATSDKVTVTGVAANQQLRGAISAEYVVPTSVDPTGRVPISASITFDGVTYDSAFLFDVTGSDLTFTVNYPPSSQWPIIPQPDGTGTKEVHVDLGIEVYENGIKIGTLGPGKDWDVFCVGFPPPPPPPPPSSFNPATPGYWKNHTNWPISTIPFACSGTGDDLSQVAALFVLNNRNAKDMTHQLAAHLIAAKLNVAMGSSASIQPTINAADAFLCTHPLGSNPQGADRVTAEELKDRLDAYNNL